MEATEQLSREHEVLMGIIYDANEPTGARAATKLMLEHGFQLSEATVSRAFARLDALGLTEALARKGRVLTAAGRRIEEQRREQKRRDDVFDRAFELQTLEEILDWLKARELLESQVAELAAVRATPNHLAELESLIAEQRNCMNEGIDPTPVGMSFHKVLTEASQSPIFKALVGSLYSPKLVTIERALDVILDDSGTMANSIDEHVEILAALRAGSPNAARKATSDHLGRLQIEARRFSDQAAEGKFPDLLKLIDAARSS